MTKLQEDIDTAAVSGKIVSTRTKMSPYELYNVHEEVVARVIAGLGREQAIHRRFKLRLGKSKSIASAALLLLIITVVGCSTQAPLGPANSQVVENAPAQAIQANGASVNAAARFGEDAGGEMVSAASEVEFVGIIGQVDIENSTMQFWNQDDNFNVVLGHVSAATSLLDANGDPVTLEDFSICFSANIVGTSVGDNEIDLVSVEMIPF